MAEEALVEARVTDSIKLVEELDRGGDAPSNVVWYFFSDAEEWRCLVAGPCFDELLPKDEGHAYQKVARAFGKLDLESLTIADVKLIRTNDTILVATRQLVKTHPRALGRLHFRDCTFNGIFVKEMLILRAA